MKQAVLDSTPADFGYDTNLWACPILAALLRDKFGVAVSDTAVRQHLKAMGLTCQKPEYQDVARDEGEIARFLDDKLPRIQRLAEKRGPTSLTSVGFFTRRFLPCRQPRISYSYQASWAMLPVGLI